MAEFLFDSSGDVIGFRRAPDDRFLFDPNGNWIGWFPWGDDDAVDQKGDYLGTVVGNRFVEFTNHPYRGYPVYPGYPGYAGYPGYPGYAGYSPLPSMARDVPKDLLKG